MPTCSKTPRHKSIEKAIANFCFCKCCIINFWHTIHRSPLAENLPLCESVRFASTWTSITCPFFPSNFSSGFSDYPFKIEYLKNPFFATFLIEKWLIWAVSSAGRARRSHRRGRGFDPLTVHQNWKSLQFSLRRFSRLTTEIPQTDFCFDHLKGTPFSEGVPFIVYCGAKSEVVFSCFTFAMLDFPRP